MTQLLKKMAERLEVYVHFNMEKVGWGVPTEVSLVYGFKIRGS